MLPDLNTTLASLTSRITIPAGYEISRHTPIILTAKISRGISFGDDELDVGLVAVIGTLQKVQGWGHVRREGFGMLVLSDGSESNCVGISGRMEILRGWDNKRRIVGQYSRDGKAGIYLNGDALTRNY